MSKGIRSEVMWFANQMEKKLRRRMAGSSVWQKDSVKVLTNRLLDEAEELVIEIKTAMDHTLVGREVPNALDIVDECVDVANFAMMIADKARLVLG